MQAVFEVEKLELGWKVSSPLMEKPAYLKAKSRAIRRTVMEIMKLKPADSFTIIINYNGSNPS